jgi:hypothetical protein
MTIAKIREKYGTICKISHLKPKYYPEGLEALGDVEWAIVVCVPIGSPPPVVAIYESDCMGNIGDCVYEIDQTM